MSLSSKTREQGQAAVEAALTLPLTVFLILGTVQLFMMLQARVLAQYAVGRAARAGSLHFGACDAMNQSAVATLLPSIQSFLGAPTGTNAQKFFSAYSARSANHFNSGLDRGQTEEIVWIERTYANRPAGDPEEDFDLQYSPGNGVNLPTTIELRMVFWYPLRVPFADWVMSRMALAHYGLQSYDAGNPLIQTQVHAGWAKDADLSNSAVAGELLTRVGNQHYTFPIETTFVTRMMTPIRNDDAQCWSGS